MFKELKHGQTVTAKAYNELVKTIRRITRITGAGGIKVRQSPSGITISGGAGGKVEPTVRRAITTAAAGATATITANL